MNPAVHRYKQNRCQQLRGFCHAATLGSVSKAAKRMGLSQPSVSQQIRSLEDELVVTLFTRSGSKMRLTQDGELLLKLARPLVEKLEHLDKEFKHQREELEEGYVQVAAGGSTILYLLPKYVDDFRRAYPKIEVRLHNVTGAEGLSQLRAGMVDFAVGPLVDVPDDLAFHPIISYDPVVITCLGHPLARKRKLSLEELSHYPLILPPRNLSTWHVVDRAFREHGLHYQVAMEIGGWEAIKLYVALGLGISIISSIGLAGEEELEVIPAKEFFPQRMYGVVVRKTGILTPLAQRFINLLLMPNGKPGGAPLRGDERTKPAGAGVS